MHSIYIYIKGSFFLQTAVYIIFLLTEWQVCTKRYFARGLWTDRGASPKISPPHPLKLPIPILFFPLIIKHETWTCCTSKCLLWNSITICNHGCRGYQAWDNLLGNQWLQKFFTFLTPTPSKCYGLLWNLWYIKS